MKTTKLSIGILFMLFACLPSPAGDLAVDLNCIVPAPNKTMANVSVVARLYEFDPLLADTGAEEVDRVTITGIDLSESRKTSFRIPLGAKRTERRSYYITVFVHPDAKSKKRLYFINGFQEVFKKKDVESLEVTLKRVSK